MEAGQGREPADAQPGRARDGRRICSRTVQPAHLPRPLLRQRPRRMLRRSTGPLPGPPAGAGNAHPRRRRLHPGHDADRNRGHQLEAREDPGPAQAGTLGPVPRRRRRSDPRGARRRAQQRTGGPRRRRSTDRQAHPRDRPQDRTPDRRMERGAAQRGRSPAGRRDRLPVGIRRAPLLGHPGRRRTDRARTQTHPRGVRGAAGGCARVRPDGLLTTAPTGRTARHPKRWTARSSSSQSCSCPEARHMAKAQLKTFVAPLMVGFRGLLRGEKSGVTDAGMGRLTSTQPGRRHVDRPGNLLIGPATDTP
ncbi:hypothetical protein SCOCK_250010 [Actinacidiphila cocklensis]|uniref:Uncharacterized protein n=1 Tax=Actinacidiphila cocklensis TaxID=887465 RepID=A0A9W4E6V2_9ACTN|nr:hypothetical protein SCOCK_250010 [Actinacidiphila cocklensis]